MFRCPFSIRVCVCVLILSHTSFSFENRASRFRHSIGMTQKSRFLFTTESSGEIAKPTELIAPAMSSYFSHDARTVRHMIWAVDIEHSENSAQKNAFSLVHSTVHSHTARQNYLCRETRIIVFMQISGWTFKLERARDNVMKVEKMERRNIKSKNRRFFFRVCTVASFGKYRYGCGFYCCCTAVHDDE